MIMYPKRWNEESQNIANNPPPISIDQETLRRQNISYSIKESEDTLLKPWDNILPDGNP